VLSLITRRLAWALPLLLVVSAVSFVLISLVPGDPARAILGPNASQAQYLLLHRQLGLDQPLYLQYYDWLRNAVHGDLGISLFTGEPVTTILNQRLWVSLTLIVAALLVAGVAGVALGTVSAVRGGRLGRAVDAVAMLGLAVPSFWLALLLIAVFAVAVPLFPATGWVPFSASPSGWLHALVLPVATLAFSALTIIVVQTRDAMLDVLSRDFIQVLRANGFPPRSILLRHALRNAAIPVVTVLGIIFIGLLTATVLVETVFALPGLGSQAVEAATQHDVPVLQGEVLYFTAIVVVVNLLTDVAYGLLDPRVRVR
jgi:peptide/nickel transport system permease protein